MCFPSGGMQWIRNHATLHERAERERHRLRLWAGSTLRTPVSTAIHAGRFGKVDVGDRGGIIVPGTTALNAPLEAM